MPASAPDPSPGGVPDAGPAGRAGTDSQRTFGLYRLEVLAALANAVLLTAVAVFVVVQAVRRFTDPPDVPAGAMLVVAAGGLVVNLIAFALLVYVETHKAEPMLALRLHMGSRLRDIVEVAAAEVGVDTPPQGLEIPLDDELPTQWVARHGERLRDRVGVQREHPRRDPVRGSRDRATRSCRSAGAAG